MRYIKVPADINQEMVREDIDVSMGDDWLDHFQTLLGGYVEQVKLGQTLARGDVVMLVDEEGLLKNKPLNSRASALYGMFSHGQPIVGDAILIGLHTHYSEDGPEQEWWNLPGDVTVDAVKTWVRGLMPKGS